MKRFFPTPWLLALLLGSGPALPAEPVIRVLALFPGKAMLSVDGQQRLLARGQTSPEGVELLDADTERALLRIGGERLEVRPGGVVGGSYAPIERREVQVPRDARGAYLVSGLVNGRTVDFIVDTGASHVVLGEPDARRLGLDFERTGTATQVATAAGVVQAYLVRFDRVRVGEVELRNVEGSVLPGTAGPPYALLGMSFLGRLDLENRGNTLIMRHKF